MIKVFQSVVQLLDSPYRGLSVVVINPFSTKISAIWSKIDDLIANHQRSITVEEAFELLSSRSLT